MNVPDKPQNKFKQCTYKDDTPWKGCGYPWTNKCGNDMDKCRSLYSRFLFVHGLLSNAEECYKEDYRKAKEE